MSKRHFLFVVLALLVGSSLGQENTFGLRTALVGPKYEGGINAVALSPDKQTLAFVAGNDFFAGRSIYIVDAITGQTLKTTSGCGFGIDLMEFVNNEKVFLNGYPSDGGGNIGCLLDLNTMEMTEEYFEFSSIEPHLMEFCKAKRLENNTFCDNEVYRTQLSPDNTLLARNEDGKTIEIQDARTQETLYTLEDSTDTWNLRFTHDGQTLVGMTKNARLNFWDTRTGEKLATKIPRQKHPRYESIGASVVEVSKDNRFLLLSYTYRQNKHSSLREHILWDIQNQREPFPLTSQGRGYQFSNDGKFLFRVAEDHIDAWNLASGQKIQLSTAFRFLYTNLFTALNNTLLFAQEKGHMFIWNLETGEEKLHWEGVRTLSIRDNLFITGNDQGEVTVWDIATLKSLKKYSSRPYYVSKITFSKDSRFLAFLDRSYLGIYKPSYGQIKYRFLQDSYSVLDATFSNKSTSLIVSKGYNWEEAGQTRIHFWNFDTDKLTSIIPPVEWERFEGYGPDGTYLISGFNNNYDYEFKITNRLDAKYTAKGFSDGTAKLYEATTGALLYTFSGHAPSQDENVSVALSPDESFIATGGYADGKIQVWETATGNLIKTLWADEGNIRNLEFSPGGNFLVTEYSRTKLWDIAKEKIIPAPIPEDEEDYWTQHTFSPNDALVTTRGRGTIYLWNSNTGELIHIFNQSGSVAFSPDGKLLVIGSAFPGLNNAVSIFGAEDNSPIFLNANITYQDTLATDETELITNGSFSVGGAGWLLEQDVWAGNTLSNFKTSPGYAALSVSENGDRQDKSIGKLTQVIELPDDIQKATLSFWYSISTEETGSSIKDFLHCQLEQETTLASFNFSNLDAAKEYEEVRLEHLDLFAYAGQRVYLSCYGESDETYPTVFRLDDFSLRLE